MAIISPYPKGKHKQFKGNLHAHTTNSDGACAPQQTIQNYTEMGYAFLMISDHDKITDIGALDACGMTLIPGNEITAEGVHMLHVNADHVLAPTQNRQPMIDAIIAQGGMAIMNHPNWGENFIHCRQSELESLTGYHGIEIYNGVSERVEGAAAATDRWDMLLSQGRRVWGFGNDDCHQLCDYGIAWNMVLAEDPSPESLLNALAGGKFYISTGVSIDSIHAEDNHIHIQSRDTQCFRIVRNHGMILATVEGSELSFEVPDCWPLSYIRVECYGTGPRMAWTQPFWIE
jgi:hypothetical protein